MVCAGRNVNLTPAVPALLALLAAEPALVSDVCWVLRRLAAQRRRAAAAIRRGLPQLPPALLAHEAVAQLRAQCGA